MFIYFIGKRSSTCCWFRS